ALFCLLCPSNKACNSARAEAVLFCRAANSVTCWLVACTARASWKSFRSSFSATPLGRPTVFSPPTVSLPPPSVRPAPPRWANIPTGQTNSAAATIVWRRGLRKKLPDSLPSELPNMGQISNRLPGVFKRQPQYDSWQLQAVAARRSLISNRLSRAVVITSVFRGGFRRRSFHGRFNRYFYLGALFQGHGLALFVSELILYADFSVEMIRSFHGDLRLLRNSGMRRFDNLFDRTRESGARILAHGKTLELLSHCLH